MVGLSGKEEARLRFIVRQATASETSNGKGEFYYLLCPRI